ncbi:hypothetical protein [Streptomyces sp. KLOTTS4A1]|uniref:hypothetical protein n=1 Tax=Streptomyces sp. KLOTTS4A1 TaxID=3390996 RepID=UPI0039F5BCB3
MSTVPPEDRPDDESADPNEPKAEGGSISDERWESFLREAMDGDASSAPKEPSARARMVTRRMQEQEAAGGTGRSWGRSRKKKEAAATPPGWRTGPAWQEMNGTRARRRKAGTALGVVLAATLAVLAVKPSLLTDHLPGNDDDRTTEAAASPTPLAAESAAPSAAPGEVAAASLPTREHPWRGSPALRWAEGADAIELPEAKAVKGLSKADVETALRHTKDFLVASNLDPAVLRGENPERALALLEPKDKELMSGIRAALREPSADNNPFRYFTRFDPDEVRVAGEVVKVRGRMSFSAGKSGQVRVHADYTFVYPLVRAEGDDDTVARTIVRRKVEMTVSDPGRWMVTQGKLLPTSVASEFGNSDCDIDDGFLHPWFPDDLSRSGPTPTGPAMDPYDRSRPMDEGEHRDCGTVTRT